MSTKVRLPETGLVFFFAGEFAKNPSVWLLDLDKGEITRCSADNQSSCAPYGPIAPDALDRLRHSALTAWQRDWPHREGRLVPPSSAPGVVDDCYVVSGNRMVRFSPLEQKDKMLSDEVERIIFEPGLK